MFVQRSTWLHYDENTQHKIQHNTDTSSLLSYPPFSPLAHTHTHTHTHLHTNTEDVEVEAFVDTLVDQLVRKAVKPNVARESQVPTICPLGVAHRANKSRGNTKSLEPRVGREN